MDLNDYWQENKRFLVTVAAGALVFGIRTMLVDNVFGDELTRQKSAVASTTRKLRSDPMYTSNDLSSAETEHAALKKAVEALTQATAFHARAQFVLDPKR